MTSPRGSIFNLQYQYDSNGQVASVVDLGGTKRYQYDAEGRIAAVSYESGDREQFGYDANGNRTINGSERASFNAVDQIVTYGSSSMSYDSRGNLVQIASPQGITRYTYNGENLLVSADLPNGQRVEFGYDAFARRIRKIVGNVTTRYIWAGDQLLAEMTEGSQSSRCDYLFFPGTHNPFALRRDGVICHYHLDALGTPRALTDESGQVVWSADYSAFGETRNLHHSVPQPFRFPGHYWDQETGLHYNRTRYYSPVWGRYLSRDPLGLIAGLNLYSYGNNDPVNESDPLGLVSGWGKFAVGALIAVAGLALVAVAAPVVLAAVAGAAVTATAMAAAVGVVAGGALIGAGIALVAAPDGCLQCQVLSMLKGARAGAEAAFAVMTLPFMGPAAGPALALAGGGELAVMMSATTFTNLIIGSAIATTIVTMTSGTGSGGNSQSSQSSTRKGGPHKETSKPTNDGMDSHHTPAKDAYKGTNLDPDDGPAIKMDPKDHRLTASNGSSEEAEAYRQTQRELIQKGEFQKAVEMDVKDIQSKFGNKYDDAIKEMLDYAKKIDPKTLQVKP